MKGLIVVSLLLLTITGCTRTKFRPEYYQDNGICYSVVWSSGGEIEAMVVVPCEKVQHIAINNDIKK